MEPEPLEIVFRHYKAEGMRMAATLGINLSTENFSEKRYEDYGEYILKLEPSDEFRGSKNGLTIGIGYFDLNMLVDSHLCAMLEGIVEKGEPFGRVYFEKSGWGADHTWYYQHRAELPAEHESGLSMIVDGHPSGMNRVVLEPGRSIDLRLKLKVYEEMRTTDLATIEVV